MERTLKYLEIVLNVPLNQSFTYSERPESSGNETSEIQNELIPAKRRRKVISHQAETGKRCEVMFGNRRMTGIIIKVHDQIPKDCPVEKEKIRPVIRVLDEEPVLPEELIRLGIWMSSYYLSPVGETLLSMIPSGKRETDAASFSIVDEESFGAKYELSDEQKNAVNGILQAEEELSSGNHELSNIHYILGKTGSGKTEVFLQTAEKILEKGKGVIYLVPEISLTSQVIEAVVQRFGQTAAVLHSNLTPSQKLSEWNRILTKKARVVIGARSAVFAPVPDLGLIIIDEEHDGSYKSGNTPRYHARQVAMYRAKTLSIPLVMGSATPSVEAMNSIKTGLFHCHRLTARLAGGRMPVIECVNLNNEPSGVSCISTELEQEIRNTLEEKRQIILFLNRRGFNHFFKCHSCGFELKCKNCSVPMTYHKSTNTLKCHYCGYSILPPHSCPECTSMDIGYSGFGTEFIENEIYSKFPNAKTVRVDTDVLTKKGELQEKLSAFKKGEYDILLGTQMIAKGLNFPNLKLVGVILADTALHLPDFRAEERAFSLITQVAGRAGRFFPDGKVIVQTYSPENKAIFYATHNRWEEFYSTEIETRKLLDFPPFSRLLRLVFRAGFENLASECAEEAKNILDKALEEMKARHIREAEDTVILGPSECPLSKISGSYRHQILLKAKSIQILQRLTRHLTQDFQMPQGVYIEIDVDPVSLL